VLPRRNEADRRPARSAQAIEFVFVDTVDDIRLPRWNLRGVSGDDQQDCRATESQPAEVPLPEVILSDPSSEEEWSNLAEWKIVHMAKVMLKKTM
jgi:hypothetical protein